MLLLLLEINFCRIDPFPMDKTFPTFGSIFNPWQLRWLTLASYHEMSRKLLLKHQRIVAKTEEFRDYLQLI